MYSYGPSLLLEEFSLSLLLHYARAFNVTVAVQSCYLDSGDHSLSESQGHLTDLYLFRTRRRTSDLAISVTATKVIYLAGTRSICRLSGGREAYFVLQRIHTFHPSNA
jgi:hypothetical protein